MSGSVCAEYRENETYLFTNERRNFNLGLFWCALIIATFFVLFTMLFKDQYKHTRTRSRLVYLTMYTAIIFQLIAGPVRDGFNAYDNLNCAGIMFTVVMVIPAFATPVIANLTLFLLMSQFAKQLKTIKNDARISFLDDESGVAGKELRYLQWLKFFQSSWGVFIFILVCFIPWIIGYIIIVQTHQVYLQNCYGCSKGVPAQTTLVIIEFVCYSVTGVFLFFKSKEFEDTYGFRSEAKWLTGIGVIGIIGYVVTIIVLLSPAYNFDLIFIVTIPCLCLLGVLTVGQLYVGYKKEGPLKIDCFNRRSKTRGDLATSDNRGSALGVSKNTSVVDSEMPASTNANTVTETKDLKYVLNDPVLYKELEEILTKECALELLLFFNDAFNWRKTFFDNSKELNLLRAKRIEKLYVRQNALLQVNLPHEQVVEIREKIETEAFDELLFKKASREVKQLLEKGAVARLFFGKALT